MRLCQGSAVRRISSCKLEKHVQSDTCSRVRNLPLNSRMLHILTVILAFCCCLQSQGRAVAFLVPSWSLRHIQTTSAYKTILPSALTQESGEESREELVFKSVFFQPDYLLPNLKNGEELNDWFRRKDDLHRCVCSPAVYPNIIEEVCVWQGLINEGSVTLIAIKEISGRVKMVVSPNPASSTRQAQVAASVIAHKYILWLIDDDDDEDNDDDDDYDNYDKDYYEIVDRGGDSNDDNDNYDGDEDK